MGKAAETNTTPDAYLCEKEQRSDELVSQKQLRLRTTPRQLVSRVNISHFSAINFWPTSVPLPLFFFVILLNFNEQETDAAQLATTSVAFPQPTHYCIHIPLMIPSH